MCSSASSWCVPKSCTACARSAAGWCRATGATYVAVRSTICSRRVCRCTRGARPEPRPRRPALTRGQVPPKSRKPRLLIVGPLPPPIGGVETFTQAVLESPELDAFEIAHCDTTKRRAKAFQGRFDATNMAWAFTHWGRLLRDVARFRPDVVYVPVSGTLSGVLRDLVLAALARRAGALVIGHQHAGDIRDV